jgi:LacI family transcriptional regulator
MTDGKAENGKAGSATTASRRATLKDVARAVGVHVSTVSRALNPSTRHLITEEIAARVLEASRALNYRPNPAAYSLRTNRSHTIGIVVPDITNSIFPPMIRGVEDVLAPHGYAALVVNTDLNREREAAAISTLSARGVDAMVVASAEREDAELSALAKQGTPVVTINRRTDDASVSSVISDEIEGVRLMLAHLVELGHRRIATIAGNQNLSTGQRRYDAFLRNTLAMGLQIGPDQVGFANAFNEAEGRRCMEELLARGSGSTAVLCANDRLAIGAISALRARGLSCPGDISVTGFNDMAMVDCIDPPLTTIRIPHYGIGQAAAQFLLQRMNDTEGGQAPLHQVLPVELIVRASTAPPRKGSAEGPSGDPAVSHMRIVR